MKHTDETKLKISNSKKGIKISSEHKEKIRVSMLGKNVGKKHSIETKQKQRQAALRRGSFNRGENHPRWVGNNVSYRALHKWVEFRLGRALDGACEHCGFTSDKHHSIHWANVSGKYLRELSDWIRLCVKCHGAYDSAKRKIKCI